jgi:hypothetical protein
MLQAYTTNQDVATNDLISFSHVEAVDSSATAVINGTEIKLNAPGIYHITGYVNASPTADGEIGVTVLLDGTAMEQTAVIENALADNYAVVPIDTLISVNRCCPCQGPDVVTIRYTGVAGTINLANVVVVKVR